MDIISIIFLVFGWVFNINGLIVTSIVLSSFGIILTTINLINQIDKDNYEIRRSTFGFAIYCIILGLSIVKLCIT